MMPNGALGQHNGGTNVLKSKACSLFLDDRREDPQVRSETRHVCLYPPQLHGTHVVMAEEIPKACAAAVVSPMHAKHTAILFSVMATVVSPASAAIVSSRVP